MGITLGFTRDRSPDGGAIGRPDRGLARALQMLERLGRWTGCVNGIWRQAALK
jgi:hypothetical protein